MSRSIVLDASASASWFLIDESNEKSLLILNEALHGRIRLSQPILWKYEIVNILKTALIQKRITRDRARLAISTISAIDVEYLNLGNEDMINILKLAEENGLSAYDATYLYSAEISSGELFTSDNDLLKLRKKYSFVKKTAEFTV